MRYRPIHPLPEKEVVYMRNVPKTHTIAVEFCEGVGYFNGVPVIYVEKNVYLINGVEYNEITL